MKTEHSVAKNLRLRVLFQNEWNGKNRMWVAQCLEHDIAAQAEHLKDAQEKFRKTLVSHIILALKHGEQPLKDIPEAPRRYWERWEEAAELKDTILLSIPREKLPTSVRGGRLSIPDGEARLRVA